MDFRAADSIQMLHMLGHMYPTDTIPECLAGCLAGFRKFVVHNVADLELLLMHNR
jgi:hypothetical protein